MQSIHELRARELGEDICAELIHRGFAPVWMECPGGDEIVIGLNIAAGERLPWTRAFHVKRMLATPDEFVREINAWKAQVRADLAAGKPSQVVKNAIAHYGDKAVRRMLTSLELAAA